MFLTDSLSNWATSIEHKGNRRYGIPRFVYPTGEAIRFSDDDPRTTLRSDANMVAISSRMMETNDKLLWIYHSPRLQKFVKEIMQYETLYPYNNCDLGLAMNVSRPVSKERLSATNVSLGFHFDTINSSPASRECSKFIQARGATGNKCQK